MFEDPTKNRKSSKRGSPVMPRRARLDAPHTPHHVTLWGIERVALFLAQLGAGNDRSAKTRPGRAGLCVSL